MQENTLRQDLLKPEIRKRKTARGKIVGYSATIGPIEVSIGDTTLRSTSCNPSAVSEPQGTPQTAGRACQVAVRDALDRLNQGARAGSISGQHYLVFPDVYGWSYWIGDCFHHDYSTREAAIDRAIHHLAQNLWNHETDDQAFLQDLPVTLRHELASWIGFQRAYIRERNAGTIPESACHRAACERPERIPIPA